MPIIFAVSDVVWQALIGAVVTVVLAYMQMRTRNAVKDSSTAAGETAANVKSALAGHTMLIDEKLNDIHTLVNSQRGATLLNLAMTARAKAVITNEPADITAADAAESEYAHHQRQQRAVDGGPTNAGT